jgi:hypothetical protein
MNGNKASLSHQQQKLDVTLREHYQHLVRYSQKVKEMHEGVTPDVENLIKRLS